MGKAIQLYRKTTVLPVHLRVHSTVTPKMLLQVAARSSAVAILSISLVRIATLSLASISAISLFFF